MINANKKLFDCKNIYLGEFLIMVTHKFKKIIIYVTVYHVKIFNFINI